MRKLLLIILVLLGSACEREPSFVTDADGVVTKMVPLWIEPQNDDVSVDLSGSVSLTGRILYNNYRLFGGNINEERQLTMRHIETGEVLWEWRDFLSNAFLTVYTPYQYENYLFLQTESRDGAEHYLIDLKIGQTVWKKQRPNMSFSAYYSGLDEHYFLIDSYDNVDGYSEGIAFKGNILTGEQDTFFYPKYSREYFSVTNVAGYMDFIKPFKNEITGESYVAIIFGDPFQHSGSAYESRFLALYNLSREETVYEKEAIYSGKSIGRVAEDPVVVDDKIYMVGGGFVACNNVYTGKSVWKKSFTTRFYGLAVDGDKVLVNSSFDNQYNTANLYALDRETGSQLWRTPSSGSSSRLVTLNGVAYFVGGGDGYLHAVDIETGKHIWRLVSPDEEHNSDAFFDREITAVPGRNGNKGIILTSSYLSAMAFEAAR